jgi:hypothetical protein
MYPMTEMWSSYGQPPTEPIDYAEVNSRLVGFIRKAYKEANDKRGADQLSFDADTGWYAVEYTTLGESDASRLEAYLMVERSGGQLKEALAYAGSRMESNWKNPSPDTYAEYKEWNSNLLDRIDAIIAEGKLSEQQTADLQKVREGAQKAKASVEQWYENPVIWGAGIAAALLIAWQSVRG